MEKETQKSAIKWGSIAAILTAVILIFNFWTTVGLPSIITSYDLRSYHTRLSFVEKEVLENKLLRLGTEATNLTLLIRNEENKEGRNEKFLKLWRDQLARVQLAIKETQKKLDKLR